MSNNYNYNKYEIFYTGTKEIDDFIIKKTYINTNNEAVKLFYANVQKKDIKIKANLIILHGFSEHMNKYFDIATEYAKEGIKVHIYDQRGFGRSGGTRAYSSFFEIYDDFCKVLKLMDENLPLFVLAHSLGGGIITSILNFNPNLNISLVILCNPWYNFAPNLNINITKKWLFNSLSNHIKEILILAPLSLSGISKDPKELEKIIQDKLSLPFLAGRFLKTFVDVSYYCRFNADKINIPFYYFAGKNDPIVPITNTLEVFDKLKTEKYIHIFENGLHELIFDYESKDFTQMSLDKILEKVDEGKVLGKVKLRNIKNHKTIYDKINKWFKIGVIIIIFLIFLQKKFKGLSLLLKILKLKK